jgi:spermidine/putrescine transport system ATP-binding protein
MLRGTVRENIYIGTVVKSTIILFNGQGIRVSSIAGTPVPAVGSLQYIHWNPRDAVIIHTTTSTILDVLDNINLSEYVEGGAAYAQ